MIHGKLNILPANYCMQKPSDETLTELGIDKGRCNFFLEFYLRFIGIVIGVHSAMPK